MFSVNHPDYTPLFPQPISTDPALEVDQVDEGVPEFYSKKVTNIAAK